MLFIQGFFTGIFGLAMVAWLSTTISEKMIIRGCEELTPFQLIKQIKSLITIIGLYYMDGKKTEKGDWKVISQDLDLLIQYALKLKSMALNKLED